MSNRHDRLLRTGAQVTEAGATSYGTPVIWDQKTIGGWTIHACGGRIVADVAGPAMSAVTSCSGPTPSPVKVALHPGATFSCGFGLCFWETVTWAALPDKTSHVEVSAASR